MVEMMREALSGFSYSLRSVQHRRVSLSLLKYKIPN